MNCTSYGSALRPNALPQSASGLMRWNGDISSSGSSAHRAHPDRRRPGHVVLALRVADLDPAAEPGLAVGDTADRELAGVLSARRGVDRAAVVDARLEQRRRGDGRRACRSLSPAPCRRRRRARRPCWRWPGRRASPR